MLVNSLVTGEKTIEKTDTDKAEEIEEEEEEEGAEREIVVVDVGWDTNVELRLLGRVRLLLLYECFT